MNADVVDVLPLVYALTGCDSTSKISTKAAALKTANEWSYKLLCFIGKTEITDENGNVEQFL